MLVLGRLLNEEIIVRCGCGEVRIVVVGFRAGRVRLGFEADRSIEIDRGEVRESKDRNPNGGPRP
jgi:carbon storage regulator CsrA